jgi:aryl-alcohol dehydrogenase-like predicted oxidoreductase
MSTFPLGPKLVRRSGYGAMQLAGPWATNPPADRAAAIGVLRAAVTAGVDHLDTAQYYGPDVVNDMIREALYPYPPELAIVSKVGVFGGSPRDEGLISGVGLSNISLEQLRHAADATEIACVQNLFHLADRGSAPVLQECLRRGIAFVPFCPLGIPRGAANPVLNNPVVIQTAARLGVTPSQVALQWLLRLAPNVLLIPGTGSAAHLRQNLAAEYVSLDDQALRELADVGA